jgi:hypothetical protein
MRDAKYNALLNVQIIYCLHNQKRKHTIHSSWGHNRNECSKEYEHHFAFMVTETSNKVPVPGKVDRSFH